MNLRMFFDAVCIAAVSAVAAAGAVIQVSGDPADRHVGLGTNGTPVLNNITSQTMPSGGSNWRYSQADNAGILVFQLPDIGDLLIETADLSVTFSASWVQSTGVVSYDPADTNIVWGGHPGSTDTTMPKWCNLYGIRHAAASTVLTNDYGYKAVAGAGDMLIQTQFLYKADNNSIGLESAATDISGDAALAAWLQAQYDGGAVAGDYVFLRIHAMFDSGNPFSISSGNSTNPPVLTITTGTGEPHAMINASPVSGMVPLMVSFSDISTGSITNRFWDFGDGETTNTARIQFEHTYTSTGTYTAALTVSGVAGISTGTVEITVSAYHEALAADAGPDQTVLDREGNGSEPVVLEGAASRGEISAWEWKAGTNILSTAVRCLVDLPVGTNIVTLTVFDGLGQSSSDALTVRVNPLTGRKQRFNLPDAPTADRFTRPLDLIWPSNSGEADICLWKDDKFAAVSFTIDDNYVPEQPWWFSMGELYNLNFTWFVITDSVTSNPSFSGPWSAFQTVADLGYDVQSHTVNSYDDGDVRTEAEMIVEYRDSITDIENNVSGTDVKTLAYPWGRGNRDVAAHYFIAARGVSGQPCKPERTDYLNTGMVGFSSNPSSNYVDSVLYGTSEIPWLGDNKYTRGWLPFLSHTHGDTNFAQSNLEYVAGCRDDLWIGLFREVALYGQERDTAVLTTVTNTSSRVVFSLSDEMDDTVYTYPLAVKVKLYPGWTGAEATQNGAETAVQIVTNNGALYALVQAVPDQGTVELIPPAADRFTAQPFFIDDFSAGWETTQTDWRVATWLQNGTQMSKDRCKTDGLGNMVQTVLAGGPPYYGGSMQTKREFGYGRWVTRIKPTSVPGVLNSFFTKDWDNLTTPDNGSDGSMAEVDIELLSYTFGASTGKVHIAIHLLGRNNYIDENIGVNFNPSDDFHEWGFDILPDRVVWHVDGHPFYTWMYDFADNAYINENYECFMNSWTMVNWILGPPAQNASYLIDWVKFYPLAVTADSDGDGIPDSWEMQYFGGATNANSLALASNGVNTVLEAYIAGLDPTDPAARFAVSNDWKTLRWTAASGRVYSVWGTTNLLESFQPLETNILWPQNSWTSPAATGEGFYKLTVKMN